MITVIERSITVPLQHPATILSAIRDIGKGLEFKFLSQKITRKHINKIDPDIFPIMSSHTNMMEHFTQSASNDLQTLLNFVEQHHEKPRAPIIMTSVFDYDIKFALMALNQHETRFRFYLRVLAPCAVDNLSDHERRSFFAYIEKGDIVLLTETNCLIKWFHSRYGLTGTKNFILPLTVSLEEIRKTNTQIQCQSNRFNIGYLGELRIEKGLFVIPEILKHLSSQLKKSVHKFDVTFIMSTVERNKISSKRFGYNLKLRKLKNLSSQNYQFKLDRYPPDPNDDQFLQLLKRTDILLLPYRAKSYIDRGSGMIVDGVMLNKPVVYTEGMGMKDLLGCGNAEMARKPKEYAAKIIQIMENIDEYRDNALKARDLLDKQFQDSTKLLHDIALASS